MIVYTYERLSQNLHAYVVPSERSYYNFNVFTTNGYFVPMPDIVYRVNDPGSSALDAVEPAVQAVLERGLVDPARVGLVATPGAGTRPLTCPRARASSRERSGCAHHELPQLRGRGALDARNRRIRPLGTGQARMRTAPLQDFDACLRNAPIHKVQDLETPMLIMFGMPMAPSTGTRASSSTTSRAAPENRIS